jgi:hypothetical protein
VHRLRQPQHVGFRRGVARVVRARLEPRHRRHVDDRAATTLDHARQVAGHQIHHCLDIHAQHLQFLVATFGAELCVDAQPSVVHQDVDLCIQFVDPCGQPVTVLPNCEIGANGDGVLAAAQLRTQLLQPVRPAVASDTIATTAADSMSAT